MADLRTLISGAVLKRSPFHTDGKALAFKLHLDGFAEVPWSCFHPVHAKAHVTLEQEQREKSGQSGNAGAGAVVSNAEYWSADSLEGLTKGLTGKISDMTLMARTEIDSEGPLANYGLDSLISVEYKQWIRRRTGVDLPFSAITKAETLKALAETILKQREQIR